MHTDFTERVDAIAYETMTSGAGGEVGGSNQGVDTVLKYLSPR